MAAQQYPHRPPRVSAATATERCRKPRPRLSWIRRCKRSYRWTLVRTLGSGSRRSIQLR